MRCTDLLPPTWILKGRPGRVHTQSPHSVTAHGFTLIGLLSILIRLIQMLPVALMVLARVCVAPFLGGFWSQGHKSMTHR